MQFLLPLLLVSFGVMAVLLFVILGRYADRGLKLDQADETLAEVQSRLEEAFDEQARLTRRVEILEAIVTSEAWDAFQEGRLPPLAAPLEEELTDEEKAARIAGRSRSR